VVEAGVGTFFIDEAHPYPGIKENQRGQPILVKVIQSKFGEKETNYSASDREKRNIQTMTVESSIITRMFCGNFKTPW
jgi:hypothetical protein